MAQVQITDLPQALALDGTEAVPIVQSGVTVQTTTGAISGAGALNYPFLTVGSTAGLTQARYLTTGSGLSLTDGGAGNAMQIDLIGAASSLNYSGTGIQVKTAPGTLTARSLAVGGGLGITNADGVSGDPTISLGSTLTGFAALTGTGILAMQLGTPAKISILGTSSQTTVTNGDGSGNITVGLASNPILPGTGSVTLPSGTTVQRPGVPSNGMLRYNSSLGSFEGYAGGSWTSFISGGAVTQINTGTGLLGGPITSTGTISIDTSVVTTLSGTQTLTNKSISGSTNTLTDIPNSALTNSSVTIGSTNIPLGGTVSALAGLTSITLTQDPTSDLQVATKQYVDSIASGLNYHQPVNYASTAALPAYTYNNGAGGIGATITANANGALSFGGGSPTAGQRLLVKDEAGANQPYNGVYTVTQAGSLTTPFILTRATDYDSSGSGTNEIDAGDYVLVLSGTNASTAWVQQTPLPITVGVTALVFLQFNAPITYTAGTGLNLSPATQFNISNTGVTAATYGSASTVPTIAINAQGQITSATNTTISIPSGQVTGLGTMATQNANNVAITGGAINGATIGGVTPAAGTFTQVEIPTATTQSTLHENTTITGWIYSGNSFSISSQEGTPSGLFFSPDGLKMYVNGSTGDDVNEYTLSSAWNIATASYVTVFSTASQDSAPTDLFFSPDGLTMFVIGDTNNTVFQYTLTTPWSVATASYASKSFSVATQETSPSGLWFKPDGTTMYIIGNATDAVYQYTLGTAWDVSTASYASISFSVAAQEGSAVQVNLSSDGTKMWVLGSAGDDIWEYTLATAWNVSTATTVNNFYVGFQETAPSGLFIDSSAANRVFMVGSTNDTVYKYNTEANSLEIDTEKLYIDGQLSVNGNLIAGANAYVDGSLTVQGGVTTGGTVAANGLTSSGTTSLASSTSSQTVSLGAGPTTSGSTKTMNIGTAGVSGSTTTINIGSNVSGSLGTTTIQAPTVNIGQTATQFQVSNTASAVNYVQVTGGATGSRPQLSAQGSDTNIGLNLYSKGNRSVSLYTNNALAFEALTPSSGVNYFTANGSITGQVPSFVSSGTDTNIAALIQSKGTGAIDLAAGSSGVNISNGGTVTAITRTTSGSGYTSIPTPVVSAPTTAGGVQATATVSMVAFGSSPTITSGGTGYSVNDVLTFVGGTYSGSSTATVTSVSGGVITGISYTNYGQYTVLPSSPVSVTGGTGSGATFTINWSVGTIFTITNAGSGYVEQPTVSFSGGGGSGAAAYATVGSGTIVKSVGSTMSFYTPGGEGFRIVDNAQSNVNFWAARGSGTGASPSLTAYPTTAVAATVDNSQAASLNFRTNTNVTQFVVSHTASAVNYVQVTGAATGSGPTISAQGSDANIGVQLTTKGTFGGTFRNSAGSIIFSWDHSNSSTENYIGVASNISTGAPAVSARGAGTNIPLVLQPKGTGALQAQQTDSTTTGGNARGANAVDWQMHRYGAGSVASGSYAVLGGGDGNTSGGYAATTVGGVGNNAANNYAFVGGGNGNTATNDRAAIVGGGSNSALGILNFIGGGFTNTGTANAAVTTQSGTMNGTTAVTLSGSNANIKVGQYITGTSIAGDTYVAAISGTSLTLSKVASGSSTSTLSFFTPHGVVVGGGNNQATGAYSFIGGGGDAGTAANRNVASGDWSVVAGGKGNTASGIGSVVAGGGVSPTGVTSANTSSGVSSFVGSGQSNTASGNNSFVGSGIANLSNAAQSAILGGTYGSTRSISGSMVFPAQNQVFSIQGSCQSGLLILARQTTDATATVLCSDGNAASTINQVILPNNSAYYFRGEIVAGVTGGGDTKGWYIEGVIKRGANAASTALVGTATVTSNYADAGASTWTVAVTADTTNGGLAVTVTGQASTTIRWVAQIRTTEMTY